MVTGVPGRVRHVPALLFTVQAHTVLKYFFKSRRSYPFAEVDEVAGVKRKPVLKTPHPAEVLHVRIFYPFFRQGLVPQIFYSKVWFNTPEDLWSALCSAEAHLSNMSKSTLSIKNAFLVISGIWANKKKIAYPLGVANLGYDIHLYNIAKDYFWSSKGRLQICIKDIAFDDQLLKYYQTIGFSIRWSNLFFY